MDGIPIWNVVCGLVLINKMIGGIKKRNLTIETNYKILEIAHTAAIKTYSMSLFNVDLIFYFINDSANEYDH